MFLDKIFFIKKCAMFFAISPIIVNDEEKKIMKKGIDITSQYKCC